MLHKPIALYSTDMKLLFFPLKLGFILMMMYKGAHLQEERGEWTMQFLKYILSAQKGKCLANETRQFSKCIFPHLLNKCFWVALCVNLFCGIFGELLTRVLFTMKTLLISYLFNTYRHLKSAYIRKTQPKAALRFVYRSWQILGMPVRMTKIYRTCIPHSTTLVMLYSCFLLCWGSKLHTC